MMVYSVLNQDAKRWWYYIKLRREDRAGEARKMERDSIRDDVLRLRKALSGGFGLIGRHGWTFFYGTGRLTGFGNALTIGIFQAALLLGIPVIDTRDIPEDRLREVFKVPICDPKKPLSHRNRIGQPYDSGDYAPLGYVAWQYWKLGATVYNLTWKETEDGENVEVARGDQGHFVSIRFGDNQRVWRRDDHRPDAG